MLKLQLPSVIYLLGVLALVNGLPSIDDIFFPDREV